MKIAIVGFDVEGKATYQFFARADHDVTVLDQNTDVEVPPGVDAVLGASYLDNLDRFDLIVRTAGMSPEIILEHNPDVAPKITSHINEFFKASPTKNIIGVTGTKGKGTTSSLIQKMLAQTGLRRAYLGGNIGVPPLSFIDELDDNSWVVLELSSFQLADFGFAPTIGVCLMVVGEHLNWHADMAEYVAAKSQLFARQSAEDKAVYFAENDLSKQIAGSGQGQLVPYFAPPGAFVENGMIKIDGQDICPVAELKLLGEHNWQNACAAVTAAWQVAREPDALRAVLTSFAGLEHRLEFVRELDGVKYYDDSFGTTPETAIVAIQAFDQPKIVILGGSDKHADYTELAQTVKDGNVRQAVVIGQTGPDIITALKKAGFDDISLGGDSILSAVETCRHHAQAGDVVLLSPACASFDMFKNYKDRGDLFKRAVNNL